MSCSCTLVGTVLGSNAVPSSSWRLLAFGPFPCCPLSWSSGLTAATPSSRRWSDTARDGTSSSVAHAEHGLLVCPVLLSLKDSDERPSFSCERTLPEEETDNCFLLFQALRRGTSRLAARSSRLLAYTGSLSRQPQGSKPVRKQTKHVGYRLPVPGGWDEVNLLQAPHELDIAACVSHAQGRSVFLSPVLLAQSARKALSSSSFSPSSASQLSSVSSRWFRGPYQSARGLNAGCGVRMTDGEARERLWLQRMRHRLVVAPQRVRARGVFLISASPSHPRFRRASSGVSEASSTGSLCSASLSCRSPPLRALVPCPQDILVHVSAGDMIESLQVVSPILLRELRTLGARYHCGMVSRLLDMQESSPFSEGFTSLVPSRHMTEMKGHEHAWRNKAPLSRLTSAVGGRPRERASKRTRDDEAEVHQQRWFQRQKIFQEFRDAFFREAQGLARKQQLTWEEIFHRQLRANGDRGSPGPLAGLELIDNFLVSTHLGSCGSGGSLCVFRTPPWRLPVFPPQEEQRAPSGPGHLADSGGGEAFFSGGPTQLIDSRDPEDGEAALRPASAGKVSPAASARCCGQRHRTPRLGRDECKDVVRRSSSSTCAEHLERGRAVQASPCSGPASVQRVAQELCGSSELPPTALCLSSSGRPCAATQVSRRGVAVPESEFGRAVNSSPVRPDLGPPLESAVPVTSTGPRHRGTRIELRGREPVPGEGGGDPSGLGGSQSAAWGLVGEAPDLAADVWCSAATFSGATDRADASALDIVVGGSSPLLQLLRFAEGSSSFRTVWQWRGFAAQRRTGVESARGEPVSTRRGGRSSAACVAVAWGRATDTVDERRQLNSSAVIAGLRDGSLYLVDVRLKETQPGLHLLAAASEADLLVPSPSPSDSALPGHFRKAKGDCEKIRTGGPVSCIQVVTSTTAVVARGSEELLLLDWREGTGGTDTGADKLQRRDK